MNKKLGSLKYCLDEGAYEDAAGHLCDLLETCRLKIETDDGMMFASLVAMVKYYGKDPKPVEMP